MSRLGLRLLLMTLVAADAQAAPLHFTDVTAAAGVLYEHGWIDPTFGAASTRPAAVNTSGVAAGDYDRDGFVDLYVVRGDVGPNLLFRNRGDGTFAEVGAAAGVALAGTKGSGPTFADVDGDGWLDLLVLGIGLAGGDLTRPTLFRNRGDGTFEDVTAASGLTANRDTVSAAFGDYDRDGDLDLFLAHWNDHVPGGDTQKLWRNDGGVFTDVSAAAGIAETYLVPGTGEVSDLSFAPSFTDLDADGWPDLLVAGDFGQSQVFRNERNGRFTNVTDRSVITDENGMGSAIGDYDGDGHLDWFVTSIWDPDQDNGGNNWRVSGNRLYRGRGDGTFEDVTDAAGVREGWWGWAAVFADLDNDGHLDLYHQNGWDRTDPNAIEFHFDPARAFLSNGDGTFTERSAALGLDDTLPGRGVVAFDYDRDGDVDLFVASNQGPSRLYRNDGGNDRHWLAVRLDGHAPNRAGIGARVRIAAGGRSQLREIRIGSNFVSHDPAEAHFGLGDATRATIDVTWPNGQRSVLESDADRLLVITQPPPGIHEQTPDQRACLLALQAAEGKIAAAAARRLARCVARAVGGTLPSGQTVDACLAGTPPGPLEARVARAAAAAARRCAMPPTFGAASAEVVRDALAALFRPRDVFGPELGTVLRDARADRAGAACQLAAARTLAAIASAEVRAFGACARDGVRRGTLGPATLEACLTAIGGAHLEAAVARRAPTLARKCAAAAVASVLPGRCAAAPPAGLAACLAERARCGACTAIRAAERLAGSCHAFEAGVARDGYCGDRPASPHSIARVWNEELLAAIRIDTPRPTVHARNLFHLSGATWDAWRAYGGGGTAWLTDEAQASADVAADRAAAISFAAYRILAVRFAHRQGARTALRTRMDLLGYDPAFTDATGDAPAALGNRIAAAVLAFGRADGANEAGNYADPTYAPVNPPLVVKEPGTTLVDPNRWQPLALDSIVTQNGIPQPDKVQAIIGAGWDAVTPFALTRDDPGDLYVDPGPPPQLGGADDAGYKEGARRIVELSSRLDPADGVLIDVSPGARGNNPLGTNAGGGHPLNPATGLPYAPVVVPRADYLRVLAEFWADGPDSETPPGHWNVLANEVSDHLASLRIGGAGPVVDRLEWDVKLYLALNGAVHDAAIVAWGLKRAYDSARPISMIRHLAGRGQSSDPLGPAYAPDGIPLAPGLIEVITAATTATGERHAALAGHEGEIAIRAYAGPPADGDDPPAGVRWQRGVVWVPYQKRTFVTPAFPGFTSGHSTFSRAAAEVLAGFTGSPFVPGGLGEFVARAGEYLTFEDGPSVDVPLQWATYYDAADQAGQSRLASGIHVEADDLQGRIAGSAIGIRALARAMAYFGNGG